MIEADNVWDAARELHTESGWEVSRSQDDCGAEVLTRIDLPDGTFIVAGDEEGGGWSAAQYADVEDQRAGELIAQLGGTDLSDFAAQVRTAVIA